MLQNPRILVVDDEPRGVELVARILRKLGAIETADSGEEGWERVQRTPLDLVVSDQRMPGMSGVELLSRIADRDPHVGRILLTGYSDLSATVDAINKGRVHAYVGKPCSPEHLRTTVGTVLEQVRLGRENQRLLDALRARNSELEAALSSVQELNRRVVESERLSAIGGMIAQIVHDFRGPLAVVSSAGRALPGESENAEEVRELAQQVVEESERMTRMCSELQDVTRVSQGVSQREMDDLDDVIAAALATLSHDAALRAVQIDSDLSSGARIPLDEDRFRRVIQNLGYNALDAMPSGGVLYVSTHVSRERVTVSVRDTGSGIPDELEDRIFEPFVTMGKKHGSGLGLAIVKKIVEEHEGVVEVGKPEGGGTTFQLHFPLARSE